MPDDKVTKIALAGEGGQGVQAVAEILAEAAYDSGHEVLYIPNFGVEQRGGVSIAFVQIAEGPVGAPKFKIGDVVVALSDRAVRRTVRYVGPQTLFVYDSGIKGIEDDLPRQARRLLPIPAIAVSSEELHPRVFNVVIMGAVIGATKVVSPDQAQAALDKKLGYKFEHAPELKELNHLALQRGLALVPEEARHDH